MDRVEQAIATFERTLLSGNSPYDRASKTPTLREVANTSPYMHDGSMKTLDEVVEFYDKGGRWNKNLDADIRMREAYPQ